MASRSNLLAETWDPADSRIFGSASKFKFSLLILTRYSLCLLNPGIFQIQWKLRFYQIKMNKLSFDASLGTISSIMACYYFSLHLACATCSTNEQGSVLQKFSKLFISPAFQQTLFTVSGILPSATICRHIRQTNRLQLTNSHKCGCKQMGNPSISCICSPQWWRPASAASWSCLPFAEVVPRDSKRYYPSITLVVYVLPSILLIISWCCSQASCDDSGWRVLEEVQGGFQTQRPEPCARCFFLFLHT